MELERRAMFFNESSMPLRVTIFRYPMIAHADSVFPFQFFAQPFDFFCFALMKQMASQDIVVPFDPWRPLNILTQEEVVSSLASTLTEQGAAGKKARVTNLQGHCFTLDSLLRAFR